MYLRSLMHSYNLYRIATYIIYVTRYACKNPPYPRILHISTNSCKVLADSSTDY